MVLCVLQAAEFTACVAIARAACGVATWLCRRPLAWLAAIVDELFAGRPVLLLYVVMIVCPLLMNLAQAWVQDAYLAWSTVAARKQCLELPRIVKSTEEHAEEQQSPISALQAPFELASAGSDHSPGRLQKRSSSVRPA